MLSRVLRHRSAKWCRRRSRSWVWVPPRRPLRRRPRPHDSHGHDSPGHDARSVTGNEPHSPRPGGSGSPAPGTTPGSPTLTGSTGGGSGAGASTSGGSGSTGSGPSRAATRAACAFTGLGTTGKLLALLGSVLRGFWLGPAVRQSAQGGRLVPGALTSKTIRPVSPDDAPGRRDRVAQWWKPTSVLRPGWGLRRRSSTRLRSSISMQARSRLKPLRTTTRSTATCGREPAASCRRGRSSRGCAARRTRRRRCRGRP